MKRIILLPFIIALLIVSCSKDEPNGGNNPSIPKDMIRITAAAPQFSTHTATWKAGDKLHLLFDGDAQATATITITSSHLKEGGSIELDTKVPEQVGNTFDLYAIYGSEGFDGHNLKLPQHSPFMAQLTAKNTTLRKHVQGTFTPVGSHFQVVIHNTSGKSLDIEQIELYTDTQFEVHSGGTYNPATGAFSQPSQPQTLILGTSQTIPAGTQAEFWTWHALKADTKLPTFRLKIRDNLYASNFHTALNNTSPTGTLTPIHALYDGVVLLTTDSDGTPHQGGYFTDARDGNTYRYTQIGNQIWMAENLKYLPHVMEEAVRDNNVPYFHVYGYNGTDVAAAKATDHYHHYGALYNWLAAMGEDKTGSSENPSGVQGNCPDGWHLPSEAEWDQMLDYVKNNLIEDPDYLSVALAAPDGNDWFIHPDPNRQPHPGHPGYPFIKNISGFTALPAGYKWAVQFIRKYEETEFWTSTEDTSTGYATRLYMGHGWAVVNRNSYEKFVSASVRCVKD